MGRVLNNLMTGWPRNSLPGITKNNNTNASGASKPTKPLKTTTKWSPLSPVAADSAYAQFSSVTSSHVNKEVVFEMDDYFDVLGNSWYAGGYDLASLPGVQVSPSQANDGAGIKVKSLDLYCLPPAMSNNTATNNVLVLSGTAARIAGETTPSTFLKGNQSFIGPSNAPSWIHLNHINYDSLLSQGYEFHAPSSESLFDLIRVALVQPDSGGLLSSTTLQFKLKLKYAVQTNISGLAGAWRNAVTGPIGGLGTTPPSTVSTSVYPRLVALQDSI